MSIKKVLALLAVLAVLAGLVIVPTGILADSASLSFSPTMQPLPTGTNRVGWYGHNVTIADETVNGETVKVATACPDGNVDGTNLIAYHVDALFDIAGAKYISFDLFADDADVFSAAADAQIRFYASLNGTVQEGATGFGVTAQTLKGLKLNAGEWNHIVLPLEQNAAYESSTKGANTESFQFIGKLNAGRKLKLANVLITDTQPEAPAEVLPYYPTMQALPEGQHRVGWYGQRVTVADENVRGETVKVATADPENNVDAANLIAYHMDDLFNISGAKYMAFDLYTDDTSIFSAAADAKIRFYARLNGTVQENGTGFIVSKDTLEKLTLKSDTWMRIVLPLEQLPEYADSTKGADTESFQFIGKMGKDRVLKIANVVLTDEQPESLPDWKDESSEPESSGETPEPVDELIWSNCDTLAGWADYGARTVDTEEKTEGTGSIKAISAVGEDGIFYIYDPGYTVDVNPYSALEFDLYLSNKDFFHLTPYKSNSILQITSSGTWDQNAMAWEMDQLEFEEGWNHVVLYFSQASVSVNWKDEPTFDAAHVNFMRLYTTKAAGVEDSEQIFRLDNLRFTKAKAEDPTPDSSDDGSSDVSEPESSGSTEPGRDDTPSADTSRENPDTGVRGMTGAAVLVLCLSGAAAVTVSRKKFRKN